MTVLKSACALLAVIVKASFLLVTFLSTPETKLLATGSAGAACARETPVNVRVNVTSKVRILG